MSSLVFIKYGINVAYETPDIVTDQYTRGHAYFFAIYNLEVFFSSSILNTGDGQS
jgi:hypothetical protein